MFRLPTIAPRLPARRPLHVAAHTLPRPTAASLAALLARQALKPGSAILYTLHPDTPDLDSLVRTFQAQETPSIGSIALSTPTDGHAGGPAASILLFSPSSPAERITPFHSSITGRPAAQVGKWQRDPLMRERKLGAGKRQEDRKGEEVGEMERVMLGLGVSGGAAAQGEAKRLMGWDALWRSGRDVEGADDEPGPVELEGVQGVQTMLLLADGTPDALLRLLSNRYPDVQKASPRPPPQCSPTDEISSARTHNVPHPVPHQPSLYVLPQSSSLRTRRRRHRALGNERKRRGRRRVPRAGASRPRRRDRTVRPPSALLRPSACANVSLRAQGNLLLRLEPSPTATGAITNPTQALIRAINAFRATLAPDASEALRPAGASSAARGISLGKGMKEEEYYLALYDERSSSVRCPCVLRIV